VPLTECGGIVTVVFEHFGYRRRGFGDDAAEAIEVIGNRRNLAAAYRFMLRIIMPAANRLKPIILYNPQLHTYMSLLFF